MSDSDDDMPRLSAETLAALQCFYSETCGANAASDVTSTEKFAVGAIGENWVRTVTHTRTHSHSDSHTKAEGRHTSAIALQEKQEIRFKLGQRTVEIKVTCCLTTCVFRV